MQEFVSYTITFTHAHVPQLHVCDCDDVPLHMCNCEAVSLKHSHIDVLDFNEKPRSTTTKGILNVLH